MFFEKTIVRFLENENPNCLKQTVKTVVKKEKSVFINTYKSYTGIF